jgi:Abnormal spindle-like microcephaly-assoc'd, ASPM-SPD-2-Hydin
LRAHRRLSRTAWAAAATALMLSGCASYGPPKITPEAVLSLSASSFNFKTLVIGQTQNQTLHLSNTGTAPLNITKLGVSDPQFVVSGPSVPRVVLPSMEVDYTLTFTPTTAGNASASLTIQSNATNAIASVSLAGVAEKVIATVAVTPSSLNFGNLNLQTTSTKNVTVQNTGDINITISGITVVGSGFGYADLSPGFSLAPNQSVTFQVWFRPQIKGAASGAVDILSANLSSPATLALAGDGVSQTTTTPPSSTPPPTSTTPPPSSTPPPTSTTPPPSTPPPTSTPPPPSTPPPTTPTPPPTPVQHTVHLTWNPSDSTVMGYRVYRSESAGSGFQNITGSLLTVTDYDDATVTSGTTYYYAVTAVDAAGQESSYSNQATAMVPSP